MSSRAALVTTMAFMAGASCVGDPCADLGLTECTVDADCLDEAARRCSTTCGRCVASGEGEGEGEGESPCDLSAFEPADEGAPDVVYVDAFRVGPNAACPAGELYEVYFELAGDQSFVSASASLADTAPVDVESIDADFDGFRGDACGPEVDGVSTVGVQVLGAAGASAPACGVAF